MPRGKHIINNSDYSQDLDLTAPNSTNIIYGGSGDDSIQGGAGNDKIFGGDGDDTLIGDDFNPPGAIINNLINAHPAGDPVFDGNDILSGGNGKDILIGMWGNNVLTGGEDADYFVFYVPNSTNTITDFTHDVDVISFYAPFYFIGASAPIPDSYFPLEENFVSGYGAFATTPDQYLIYDRTTGDLSFDPDGSNKDYDPVIIGHFVNNPEITYSDLAFLPM